MINILKSIYWEFLSYFVPQKQKYRISGSCNMCGKCCRYMYSKDLYTPKEFKIMQFIFPSYKRFYIRGKDLSGNLVFACKYVRDDGLCSVYNKRLRMCKSYPKKFINYPAQLHEGCGFYVEKKEFKDFLKN